MTSPERRGRRVVESHRIASSAFRLAAAFGAVAVVWAGYASTAGGSWWGPLHAFLAGVIVLAISGASQMFTVTWAAAVPPPPWIAALQRWSVAAGAAAALVGVGANMAWLVVLGAAGLVAGLGLLAVSLLGAVRRSLLRRFDLSSRFYLLAITCAVVGIPLGALMGSGAAGEAYDRLRLVHSHLNLVGFVGFTIVGTLPTILPTLAHHKAVSGGEARAAWWLSAAAALLIAGHLALPRQAVGAGTVAAGVAVAAVVVGVVARLRGRGWEGGLPYWQVAAGSAWLAGWAVAHGVALIASEPVGYAPGTGAVVVAGVGQVLAGSLAYLVPVLIGPAPLLGRNLERMARLPWLPFLAVNLAGPALLAGLGPAALVLVVVWVADFSRRLLSLEWGAAASHTSRGG